MSRSNSALSRPGSGIAVILTYRSGTINRSSVNARYRINKFSPCQPRHRDRPSRSAKFNAERCWLRWCLNAMEIHSIRPFAIIVVAFSTFAPLHAQSCCSGRMAFVSQQNSINHLYLMDVDASGVGANPTKLTSDGEPENYPSWSPDGKRLVYQRDFNGSAIYVINADGTAQQRLSPTPGFDVTPSWSPDGTKIVYARLLAVPQPNELPLTDIRVMNADGTGDHAVLAN